MEQRILFAEALTADGLQDVIQVKVKNLGLDWRIVQVQGMVVLLAEAKGHNRLFMATVLTEKAS